jgi:hypothetical protein
MSGLRTMRRSMARANGLPLRRGAARASDGSEKGPARMPSAEDVRQAKRRARKADAARLAAKQKAA